MPESHPENFVVLFDGACHFCNSSVNFIVHHDKNKKFVLLPCQSAAAKEFLNRFNLAENYMESLVLIEGNNIFFRSTAALRIARHLNTPVKWLYGFIVIPKFIRDPVYDWIAKHRNQLRKQSNCVVTEKR